LQAVKILLPLLLMRKQITVIPLFQIRKQLKVFFRISSMLILSKTQQFMGSWFQMILYLHTEIMTLGLMYPGEERRK